MLRTIFIATLINSLAFCPWAHAEHCPFCSSVNMTLGEKFKINDLVVIASVTDAAEIPGVDGAPPKRQLEVTRIFKGENFIQEKSLFWVPLKGDHEVGKSFLCWGIGPPLIAWAEPIASHPRIETYLEDIQPLPEKGSQRLEFFQNYLEDELEVIATDAYDEFAIATYEDLLAMKNQMQRDKLLSYVSKPDVDERDRRLYFTMLGVCGTAEDIPLLEKFLTSANAVDQAGLDSLVACYLCIKGHDGLELVEKQFLNAKDIEFSKIFQVVSALRFHGTEVQIVDREKLVATVRKLVDRPRLADAVIPDLARWEDWSVVDQLVAMFKDSEANPAWIRVPIFQYLIVCPLPEAKKHLEELRQLDPTSYQRAMFLSNLDDSEDEELEEEDHEDWDEDQ